MSNLVERLSKYVAAEDGDCGDFAKDITEAISIIEAALSEQEVVAWLCDAEDGENCEATSREFVMKEFKRFGRKITPLFASPQPQKVDGMMLVPVRDVKALLACATIRVLDDKKVQPMVERWLEAAKGEL